MSMSSGVRRAAPVNVAHLGLLALVLAYAWLAHRAAWSPFALTVGGLMLTLAWLGLVEWRWPHRRVWHPEAADLRRDATFFGANALADTAADALLRVALPPLAVALAPALHGSAAATLPLPLAVVLVLWGSEFFAYWLHRAMHHGGWWWRVHAVHHRPHALNVSNNFTTHPLNVLLLKLVRIAPLVLLGFSAEAIVLAGVFFQAQSFAAHANTRGSMGWLNYVIGTAELHRWHHSTRSEEALNFGTVVPLWDQLFGTFRWRRGEEPLALGLEEPADFPPAHATLALLQAPFVARKKAAAIDMA